MTTLRACKICDGWHDMAEPWPEKCLGHYRPRGSASTHIIKDIEPYQAMGSDVASSGKAPRIGGRRQHREYLRRNGYVEIGNDRMPDRKPVIDDIHPREIKQTIDRLRNR